MKCGVARPSRLRQFSVASLAAMALMAALPSSAETSRVASQPNKFSTGNPNVHRLQVLSGGTLVVSYWDQGAIRFRTAEAPYSEGSWSAPITAGMGSNDFAVESDGNNSLYFAFQNSVDQIDFVSANRNSSVWTIGNTVNVEPGESYAPSIAVRPTGLAIAYERYTKASIDELRLASSGDGGTTWMTETVRTLDFGSAVAWSAVAFVDQEICLAFNDTHGTLNWICRIDEDSWSSPVGLGSVVDAKFSMTSDGQGVSVARQTCGGCAIRLRRYTGSWGQDEVIASTATSGPTVSSDGTTTRVSYSRFIGAGMEELVHRDFSNGSWGPETPWISSYRPFDQVWEHLSSGQTLDVWRDQTDAAKHANPPLYQGVTFGNNQGDNALLDDLYIGLKERFEFTQFVLNGTYQSIQPLFEYWNGSVWGSLPGIVDGTQGMQRAGSVTWSRPADWQQLSLNGSENLYYVRVRRTESDPLLVGPSLFAVAPIPYMTRPSSLGVGPLGTFVEMWSQRLPNAYSFDVVVNVDTTG